MLDVQDALEFDIARQYLMAYPIEELAKHDQLATLRKIIENGARYPRVRLGDYLRLNTDRIKPGDFPETRFRVLGVSNTDGVFLNETKSGAEIKQANFRVKPNEFCYNPYRVNVGSIGLCEFDYDNQIISGAYNIFGTDETELLPHYLLALFKSPQFLEYVNGKAHGGFRMNFKFEDIEEWEIPLPPTERQSLTVTQFRETEHMVNLATKFLNSWAPEIRESADKRRLGDFIAESMYGISDRLAETGTLPVLRMNNLDARGIWDFDELKYAPRELPASRILRRGDFLFNRTNSIDLVGKSSVVDFDFQASWAGYLICLRFTPDLNPLYVKYLFATPSYRSTLRSISKPAGGQANINAEQLADIQIDYLPRPEQDSIVESVTEEYRTVSGMEAIRRAYARRQEARLNTIWNE